MVADRWCAALLFAAVLATAACAGDRGAGGVAVHDVRIAESVNGATMAVYARIENDGPDDALIGLRPGFDAVGSLHEMRHEGGVMTMSPIERIELPGGSTTELRSGALHGMLAEMGSIPAAGDTVSLTFTFAFAPQVTVRAPVLTIAELASEGMQHDP